MVKWTTFNKLIVNRSFKTLKKKGVLSSTIEDFVHPLKGVLFAQPKMTEVFWQYPVI